MYRIRRKFQGRSTIPECFSENFGVDVAIYFYLEKVYMLLILRILDYYRRPFALSKVICPTLPRRRIPRIFLVV
jgi:hypothetical protein